MNDKTLEQRKNELVEDIENLRRKFHKSKRKHVTTYSSLIGSGIGLSAAAAIVGFLDIGPISGIIPLIVGALISLESALKFGEKGEFYRVLVTECENLKIALKYRVDTEDKLQLIVKKFQIVVTTSARSLPRGQGMQAVKALYEDLDREGILLVPELEGKT